MNEDPRPDSLPLDKTVLGTLGIELVEVTGTRVEVALDVGPRVHQPYGYLHGGVSVLLCETAASLGAGVAAGPEYRVFGMEINANHVRTLREGAVRAVATPIHVGRTSQVWQAQVSDQDDRLISVSRCTVAVRPLSEVPQ